MILLAILAGGVMIFGAILNMGAGGVEKIGFIDGVTTNGNYGIVFDEAEWLTGEEGEDAAIAAGLCTEGTRFNCLPNDFIISNPSTATQPLEFANGIIITMQTLRMEEEGVKPTEISRQEFERLINDRSRHWNNFPYRIVVKNGLIISIEEVYTP